MDLLVGHPAGGDDSGGLVLAEGRQELLRRGRVGQDDVVAKHIVERLAGGEPGTGGEGRGGVAVGEGIRLSDEDDVRQPGDAPDLLQQRALPLGLQMVLQVRRGGEVALDHLAGAPHDDDDLVDARRRQHLHVILDQGDPGDGEHLLGDRFGRG